MKSFKEYLEAVEESEGEKTIPKTTEELKKAEKKLATSATSEDKRIAFKILKWIETKGETGVTWSQIQDKLFEIKGSGPRISRSQAESEGKTSKAFQAWTTNMLVLNDLYLKKVGNKWSIDNDKLTAHVDQTGKNVPIRSINDLQGKKIFVFPYTTDSVQNAEAKTSFRKSYDVVKKISSMSK